MKAMIRKMNWGGSLLRGAYLSYHLEKREARCWNDNFHMSGSGWLDHSESAAWGIMTYGQDLLAEDI